MNDDFCVQIDYEKNSENPERVFTAMAQIIQSLQELDKDLIGVLDAGIKPLVLLENIETGSIKTWLKHQIESTDDQAIRELNWKELVGAYLVRAKYLIIKFLEPKSQITSHEEIKELQNMLLIEAENTKVKRFPFYRPIPPERLIGNINNIQNAISPLTKNDKAIYLTKDEKASFNIGLSISPEMIEEILTKESIENKSIMILKVKKPDYLGESKWDFIHANKSFSAKIVDVRWLSDFQNRSVTVKPGDSLRAEVQIIVKYGYDNNVVGVQHNILKVIKVLSIEDNTQTNMFP